MKKELMKFGFLLLTLLAIPFISANIMIPPVYIATALWFVLCVFFLVVFAETFVFLLLAKRVSKLKTRILKSFHRLKFLKSSLVGKSFLIVLIANLVSTLIGLIFVVGHVFFKIEAFSYFSGIPIAFVLSILIEFVVYLLFFLKDKKINKLYLLFVSFIANLVTYIIPIIGYIINSFI